MASGNRQLSRSTTPYYEQLRENKNASTTEELKRLMPHSGIQPTAFPQLEAAVHIILNHLYKDQPPAEKQLPYHEWKQERNAEIRARYEAGETLSQLATEFGVSFQRVQQIVKHRNH